MLMNAAHWIIASLFPDMKDDDELRILCIYGCEVWIYTWLSTLGLLIIGLLFHSGLETVIIITIFYLCQTHGGGFHASTHLRCFLTMVCGLLSGLVFTHLPTYSPVLPCICFLSFLILLAFPLQLHPNKKYLAEHFRKLRIRSYCVTFSLALCIGILYVLNNSRIFCAATAAVCLSAFSRLFAVIQKRLLPFSP